MTTYRHQIHPHIIFFCQDTEVLEGERVSGRAKEAQCHLKQTGQDAGI